jgi:CubicO group peptidase (beta-lactamase class C family)
VSRATRKPLADYLSEKLWRPYGMEADAYWQTDQGGHEIAGCCLSARLRDYGRIGQFMLDGGTARGRPIVPAAWIAEATRTKQPFESGNGYGYQWWTGADGTYAAIGIFGQSISIDPALRLVIVTLGAWPEATDSKLSAGRAAFLQRVRSAVARPVE